MSTTIDISVFVNVPTPVAWGDLADGPMKDIKPAKGGSKGAPEALASPEKGSTTAKGGLVKAPKASADPKKGSTTAVEELMEASTTPAGSKKSSKTAKGGSKGAPEATPAARAATTPAFPNFGKGSGKTEVDVRSVFGLDLKNLCQQKLIRDTTEQMLRENFLTSFADSLRAFVGKKDILALFGKGAPVNLAVADLKKVVADSRFQALTTPVIADPAHPPTQEQCMEFIKAMFKGVECLTATSFPMSRTLKCHQHIEALRLEKPQVNSYSISAGWKLICRVTLSAEQVIGILQMKDKDLKVSQEKINKGLAATTAAKDTFMLLLLEQLHQHRLEASKAEAKADAEANAETKAKAKADAKAKLAIAEKHYDVQQSKLHATIVAEGDFDIVTALAALQTKLNSLVQDVKDHCDNMKNSGAPESFYTKDALEYMVAEGMNEIWSTYMLPFFAMPGADPTLAAANAVIFEKLKRRLALSVMQSVKAVLGRTEAGEEISIFTPDYGFGVLDATNPAHSGAITCAAHLEVIKAQMLAAGLI